RPILFPFRAHHDCLLHRDGSQLLLSDAAMAAVLSRGQHWPVAHRPGHALLERRSGRRDPRLGAGRCFDRRVCRLRSRLNLSYCRGDLGCSANALRNATRLLMSTIAVPVSTNVGSGAAGAVAQSLNSWTTLGCKSSRNLTPSNAITYGFCTTVAVIHLRSIPSSVWGSLSNATILIFSVMSRRCSASAAPPPPVASSAMMPSNFSFFCSSDEIVSNVTRGS